jgi:hypothetical protein
VENWELAFVVHIEGFCYESWFWIGGFALVETFVGGGLLGGTMFGGEDGAVEP